MTIQGSSAALVGGALIVGALGGGFLGAVLGARSAQPSKRTLRAPAEPGAGPQDDSQLLSAIQALTAEVRLLGSRPSVEDPNKRVPAPDDSADQGSQNDELVLALDRLSAALQAAPGRSLSGGIGLTSIDVPTRSKNLPALRDLVQRDQEEISRAFRFWSVQRTLDHFGPPDQVSGDGNWLYEWEDGDDGYALTFRFSNGYLQYIWN